MSWLRGAMPDRAPQVPADGGARRPAEEGVGATGRGVVAVLERELRTFVVRSAAAAVSGVKLLRGRSVRQRIAALEPGRGVVMEVGGEPVAVFRASDGALSAVSGVCTHDGQCPVVFDEARTGWRCPRHGARFDLDGNVVRKPATLPLRPVELKGLE